MIPTDYVRLSWILNARGPSGVRVTGFAIHYSEIISADGYESPGFFSFLAGRMAGDWWDAIAPAFFLSTSATGCQIATANGSNTFLFPAVTGTRSVGSGAQAPPQEAVVAQLRSQDPGRRGRGRMFLPDVSEDDFDENGIIVAASSTIFEDAVNALISASDDITAGTADENSLDGLHILHRDGSTPSRVTAATINNQPGWLRRRGRP